MYQVALVLEVFDIESKQIKEKSWLY